MSNTNAQVLKIRELPVRVSAPFLMKSGWHIQFSALRRQSLLALQFAIFPLSVLALWWFVSSREILPANILPCPSTVFQTLLEQLSGGELVSHLVISLWRVAQGVALGVTLGLLLGVALGTSPDFESWIGPSFRTLVQIPSIALIPLFMMVLGIDDKLKLFIMTKACLIPLALITADGIRNIPNSYIEVSQVLKLRRWTYYRWVVLPGAMPAIFTGVRQGVAHVWVSLVAVEVMASADGIGYLMTWSRLLFQLDMVLVCVATIGVTGFALDFGMRKIEAHLLKWRGNQK
jgi:sulfonate transport system permease protein